MNFSEKAEIEALTNSDDVHHLIIYGCKDSYDPRQFVKHCHRYCRGEETILYAWGLNAPKFKLPSGKLFSIFITFYIITFFELSNL